MLPPLKIHTWGGLGSQLFAIALASDFHEKFPERRLQIVFHTGGVTHRYPEVKGLFPEYEYRIIDDYRPKSEGQNELGAKKVLSLQTGVRFFIKKMLRALFFVASADNDFEFLRLKPWVLSCRGHYSYRTIKPDLLNELDQRLHRSSIDLQLSESCTVHYRLGDLLTLAEKSPIPTPLLVSEVNNLAASIHFRDLYIFSDSPEKVYELFNTVVSLEVKSPNVDTVSVMANSIDSKYFIGTSSKISFWISGIRAQSRNSPSIMPSSNLLQYAGIVGKHRECISTYQVSNQ